MGIKRILTTAIIAVASLGCYAASPNHICLTFIDGSTAYLDMRADISEQNGTVFALSGNTLKIKVSSSSTAEESYAYEVEQLRNISFVELESSGIANIANENAPVILLQGDGLITVKGVTSINSVNVYDIAGRMMSVEKTTDGASVSVSLASLPTGVYIVSCSGSTLKVSKK